MKLRILGNSVRLRLSQTEVSDVLQDMHVSDSVDFGDSSLIYSLQGSDVPDIRASFSGNFVTVDVPAAMLQEWGTTEQVSLSHHQELPGGGNLHILIEKDFACLSPRKGEEDMFPNPKADN